MFGKKKQEMEEKLGQSKEVSINERTNKALVLILQVGDALNEVGSDPTAQQKAVRLALPHMEDVYARFSTIKKLKTSYEYIKAVKLFPDENIRLNILSFYYAGKDALEKEAKKTVTPACECGQEHKNE